MMTLTCPYIADNDETCGADATALEVDPETGEFGASCDAHMNNLGGRGITVVWAAGPLHSTSLFTR